MSDGCVKLIRIPHSFPPSLSLLVSHRTELAKAVALSVDRGLWESTQRCEDLRVSEFFPRCNELKVCLARLEINYLFHTPHYTTLHHTTPHYTTLHHTTPRYTTLNHTKSHYTKPQYSTLHYTTRHYTTQKLALFSGPINRPDPANTPPCHLTTTLR